MGRATVSIQGFEPETTTAYTETDIEDNSDDLPPEKKTKKSDFLNQLLNQRNEHGETGLLVAVEFGRTNHLKTLIQAGADVNVKTNNEEAALMIAVKKSFNIIAQLLITVKSDISLKNTKGESAILIAAEMGNVEILRCLLEAGADINDKSNTGDTPLILSKNEETAESIIQSGAELAHVNHDGVTALHTATRNSRFKLVKYFVELGLDVNTTNGAGETALIIAVLLFKTISETSSSYFYSSTIDKDKKALIQKMIHFLIDSKADASVQDRTGKTALMYAHEAGCNETIINMLESK
ncbi:putative ankyrin repeat protein RF_0381 [Physella acuta]|uniref:putative ankyrin repeat protein RF_0381 n=1 Tax=Physella acuta TaxID=109671 RepID=UPI0027DB8F09|nr:putative ankyrin repeat protein RF_0381 [Physella acuta]